LYEALTRKGLNVWYDKMKLKSGSDWMVEIEKAIDTSRLFIPILTDNTIEEGNDFHLYRKEWKIADRRAEGYSRRYIIPLAASGVDFYKSDFPKSFLSANASFFDDASINFEGFAKSVLDIINSL
jgi:hypothetical protein